MILLLQYKSLAEGISHTVDIYLELLLELIKVGPDLPAASKPAAGRWQGRGASPG